MKQPAPTPTEPKRILWLTWKDYHHPQAGGAEVVLREIAQRFVKDGYNVTFLTAAYPGAAARETMDGIEIIRVGANRYLHPLKAFIYYMRHLRGHYDILIEQINTSPYFCALFERRAKRFVLCHQLLCEVWNHETPPPISYVGRYMLEPLAIRIMGRAKLPLITISESTKQDMARLGFAPERTHVISEGLEIEPVDDLEQVTKYAKPTLLSLGSMRSMKRTLDQVKAFELAKPMVPNLQLKVAGSIEGKTGKKVIDYIGSSPFAQDIEYVGRPSRKAKIGLMRRAHLIMQTAVKEGWGLTVTEANSQGTPAVVYDVDGLRDSVRHGKTGLITTQQPDKLAAGIVGLIRDSALYKRMQKAGWKWSQSITFDASYQQMKHIVEEEYA